MISEDENQTILSNSDSDDTEASLTSSESESEDDDELNNSITTNNYHKLATTQWNGKETYLPSEVDYLV